METLEIISINNLVPKKNSQIHCEICIKSEHVYATVNSRKSKEWKQEGDIRGKSGEWEGRYYIEEDGRGGRRREAKWREAAGRMNVMFSVPVAGNYSSPQTRNPQQH